MNGRELFCMMAQPWVAGALFGASHPTLSLAGFSLFHLRRLSVLSFPLSASSTVMAAALWESPACGCSTSGVVLGDHRTAALLALVGGRGCF